MPKRPHSHDMRAISWCPACDAPLLLGCQNGVCARTDASLSRRHICPVNGAIKR